MNPYMVAVGLVVYIGLLALILLFFKGADDPREDD